MQRPPQTQPHVWIARAAIALTCACAPDPVGPEAAKPPEEVVVASWSGGRILLADLEGTLHDELTRLRAEYEVARYERLHQALDGAVETAHLDAEARKRSLPNAAALLEAEVEQKLGEPTEEELRVEFSRFVEQVPGADFATAAPFLRKELLTGRRQARHLAFLGELKQAYGLAVSFPFPEIPRVTVPIDPTDPTLGSAEAPLTIVAFGGFECLYCKRVDPTLRQLVEAYPGRVRLVVKDFPLPGHGRAEAAAVAAHCAGMQGRYWDMSTLLFAHQGRFEDAHLAQYAQDLGLDTARWQACFDDPSWRERIAEDVALGRKVGVQSTPSFFFNGLPVAGAHTFDRLASLVDEELVRAPR